jgi:transposase InsO family protein
MKKDVKIRVEYIKLYEECKDAGYVCRRFGISRPTLRKWYKRYKELGTEGLSNQSKRPNKSPNIKLTEDVLNLIKEYRESRKLGARRIQSELIRNDNIKLSLATIHKALERLNVKPLVRTKRTKQIKRYSKSIPGQRMQMDVTKIKNSLYQYTAIDDCTRYRVLALYSRKSAKNTLNFIDKVIEETPFPIQIIQTDRGGEFFAIKVQKKLMEYSIKFRPIKPGSPHLNGKVERSQQTDLQEFYSTIDLDSPELELELGYWQHYYNWDRPHSSLNGKTPMDRYHELSSKTPFWDDVIDNYDPSCERIREQNYKLDLLISKLKPSM